MRDEIYAKLVLAKAFSSSFCRGDVSGTSDLKLINSVFILIRPCPNLVCSIWQRYITFIFVISQSGCAQLCGGILDTEPNVSAHKHLEADTQLATNKCISEASCPHRPLQGLS